ncbi:NAD(P)-dependent dehydrogenase, short-chain alcohol dehydrogenase family [Lentzea fradiae]|uniref:NAD(P)-dependent dehydrogenase, short-chain alcohol dehydrogenase family n=1 Tax=Lentzea fradiae TaxID=200378 RepID=A0A1G7UMK8_9PSEU|nr:oxidoreductase [Lentzea fradiae]SDG48481.1 NAD(P)-dependent dehydrogenase, short-chain alcohol dehydrogenase family [Lentzea fradiae]
MSRQWSAADVPRQDGRTVVVTGANSGLGFAAAAMFAAKGADVVLACRSEAKAEAAVLRIGHQAGSVRAAVLDLADLGSVRRFADEFREQHDRLDVLVNNAGVMWSPLTRTAQGFEVQFGTNHLGHFALTGHLLPLLLRTPGARVTTATSLAQGTGKIDFDDLNWHTRKYSTTAAYAQSKLANMMFTLELGRRLRAAGSAVVATASHPGWTATELTRHSPGVLRKVSPLIGMPPGKGVLPTMRAATDPAAPNGSCWGPAHLFETKGHPEPARVPRRAQDAAVAGRLWEESTRLTEVRYDDLEN